MQRQVFALVTRALSVIIALSACTVGPALRAPGPGTSVDLAAGVALIPGGFDPGRQPDGNTLIFRGTQGLVVMDTGRHPEHTQRILDYAVQVSQPIVAVVNSHWHLDHISGNPRLRAVHPELRVYASSAIEGAMVGFLAKSRQQGLEFLKQPGDPVQQAEIRADLATIDSGTALYPDVYIESPGKRVLAGRRLQVGLEHYAVTGGDVWLYDAETRVLAAGDLVTLPAPFFDTACPGHWRSVLARLESVHFDTLVPGHGSPMSRTDFTVYRRAFDSLLTCAASPASNGECSDGWQRDAAVFLATDRDKKLARALTDYYLEAVLRGDQEKNAALCGVAQ